MNDRLGDLFGTENGEVPSWALEEEEAVVVKPSSSLEEDDTAKKKQKKKSKKHHDDGGEEEEGDVELGKQQQQQPKYMESFFHDVDNIKADVDAIREATKRVGEINEEAIKATTTSKEEELSRALKPLIDKTNKRAKRTKNLLALLKEENIQLVKEGKAPGGGGVAPSDLRYESFFFEIVFFWMMLIFGMIILDYIFLKWLFFFLFYYYLFVWNIRIRENLCNTLTRKFIDEMKLYQTAQQKYKNDIKKKVKRQVQIVQPDATEEDIDAILHSEGGREALYKEKILAGRVADPIK